MTKYESNKDMLELFNKPENELTALFPESKN